MSWFIEITQAPLTVKLTYLILGLLMACAAIFSDYVHRRDFGLYARVLETLEYWKGLYIHWRIKRRLKTKWRDQ